MKSTGEVIEALERLESRQLNLGLYNTHITAEDLRRYLEEQKGEAPSLNGIEAALRDLISQGEAIEWRSGYFRSRIAETVRCLRLLRQRLWWHKDLSDYSQCALQSSCWSNRDDPSESQAQGLPYSGAPQPVLCS